MRPGSGVVLPCFPTSSLRAHRCSAPGPSRLAPGQGLRKSACGRPLPGGAVLSVSRRCAVRRRCSWSPLPLRSSQEDPGSLVESCQKALLWILRTHRGRSIRRCWVDGPCGEEEITLLEEEVLLALVLALVRFLSRLAEIDGRLEEAQAAESVRLAAQEAQAAVPRF